MAAPYVFDVVSLLDILVLEVDLTTTLAQRTASLLGLTRYVDSLTHAIDCFGISVSLYNNVHTLWLASLLPCCFTAIPGLAAAYTTKLSDSTTYIVLY